MQIHAPRYDHKLGGMSDDAFARFMGDGLSDLDMQRAYLRLLEEARGWYDTRTAFREQRREARDFYRGKQWERMMDDPDNTGSRIRERDYITRQGRIPMVMNLVSNVLNNVDGQFRQNKSERMAFAVERSDEEAVKQMNLARRATRRFNDSAIIEADQFKEHCLSGASCFKSTYEWVPQLNRQEVRDYEVDQTRLFFNTDISDRRFSGLRLIGELHDLPLADVVSMFARSQRDASRIEEQYGKSLGDGIFGYDLHTSEQDYGFSHHDGLDFMNPYATGQCRVIEVWHLRYRWTRLALDPLFETIPGGYGEITLPDNDIARIQNERRAAGLPLLELDEPRYEQHWHVCYLTPTGECLKEAATPFAHGEHPYSPGLALLIDGETWGLIDQILDPQRWLNRLVINIDHMMATGAKGAIAYDETYLEGTDTSRRDVSAWYASTSADLPIKVPQGKSLNDFLKRYAAERLPAGYADMLPVVQQWIDRISGVTEALQGFAPKSGTPAALYQQQILQAATSVLGYVQTYFETLRRKDRKEIKLLQQVITEPRAFPGTAGGAQMVAYDPAAVAGLDFDVAMGDVADTATYRQLWEQDLMAYWQAGAIPFDVFLEMSSHPRSEELLRALQNWQATQASAQMATLEQLAGQQPQTPPL